MLETLYQYKEWFVYLAWFSLALFLISIALIPWLVVKIPSDYFHESKRHKISPDSRHPVIAQTLNGMRNLLGFALIILGIFMLVLPGQGILTIIIGLFLMNFPGKYRLERKLVSMPKVLKSLNWIRAKANKRPFILS